VQDFSELPESSHVGGEVGEIHHFVLGRGLGEEAGWEVAGQEHGLCIVTTGV
jgi:hypothetical protein